MTPDQSADGRSFIKMHGLQNHFVIVDGRDSPYSPDREEVVRICNPATGVGADQLIIIEDANERADVRIRILNSDGHEAQACGNGTRCVAWLLFEETGRDTVIIETLAGELGSRRISDRLVSVNMGKIRQDWESIPLSEARDTLHLDIVSGALRDGVAVNVGNPHVVFFVEDLDSVDVPGDAVPVQEMSIFPEGVNVGVAQATADDQLRLKVYERGAGLTLACGSGACAAAYAARQRGLANSNCIQVFLPGGSVGIDINDDDTVTMTGPIELTFRGTLAD